MVTITVDQEKCTSCGIRVTTCPLGVYEMRKASDSKKSFPVNVNQCIACRA